ncbi:hypothetical protein PISMIDRAFT_43954, partial [Pisolithus microcarpus 441]
RPPGHDDCDVALRRLADALHNGFKREWEINDLNEANTLYRAALELLPVEHPDRASSLHDIAQCLADRSRQKSTATDLDEVVAAEQEALRLLELGNPG